jgi:P27 family predicted phage terminase small subunit
VPTALKIARGNPGQRRISADEPEPSTAIDLKVPEILADDVDARAEWERTAPMLYRIGVLTEADIDCLTLYCQTFSTWKQAIRQIRKFGMIVQASKRNPFPIPSPYLSIATKAAAQCRALLGELGLTPVARVRVHVAKREKVDAQRERFFGASSIIGRSPAS